ncbi:hypothetical protein AVEN_199993-1 [Araneus ventricosus]|uniref:Uncharacterized protein n=1 Tax=Araneus ventricosus TaxID=182803 RepID=A0A4Y2BXJ9_ARAVE|nr:hypothetical protein AVEN_199993-1 [Araneus ventricosus]
MDTHGTSKNIPIADFHFFLSFEAEEAIWYLQQEFMHREKLQSPISLVSDKEASATVAPTDLLFQRFMANRKRWVESNSFATRVVVDGSSLEIDLGL